MAGSVHRHAWLAVTLAGSVGWASACGVPDYGFEPDGSVGDASDNRDAVTVDSASGGSGGTGGGSDAGGAGGCSSNADCAELSATPICDPASSTCVECLDGSQTCPAGMLCKNKSCVVGCDGDEDCAPLPNTENGFCDQGSCGLGVCSTGYENCNNVISDGCEASLLTDGNNCGTCAYVCDLLNASSVCQAGVCTIVSCSAGYASCDNDSSNGCEVDTTSNLNHCGQCDKPCAVGSICSSSSCMTTGCSPGFVTCDANNCACAGDGCCGTSCQVKHNNGLGQSWYDCTPYATYDAAQAAKACQSHMTGTGACVQLTCGGGLAMCNTTTAACWGFTSAIAGKVYKKTGTTGPPTAICPISTDANWDP